jgi:uncharacterized lipoprotein
MNKAKGLFGLRLSSPSHSRGSAKTVAAVFLAALLAGCGVENELRPCAHAASAAPNQMAAESPKL